MVIGCSLASLCANLVILIIVFRVGTPHRAVNTVRAARKETYTIILGLAAHAGECFNSALIRQKLLRSRPGNPEIGIQVDEDLANGWAALEELSCKLKEEQLICSDSIVALLSDAKTRHFWNAESLFRVHGHAALDLDELHKHTRDLVAKLKQRCRREIGLKVG
ncbi:MAG: hypothetical protein ACJ8AI_25705 [Rhodopila sp.]